MNDGHSRTPHWLGDIVRGDELALDYWLNRYADGRTHRTHVSEETLRGHLGWGRSKVVTVMGRLVAAGRVKRRPRRNASTETYVCQTPNEPAPWEADHSSGRAVERAAEEGLAARFQGSGRALHRAAAARSSARDQEPLYQEPSIKGAHAMEAKECGCRFSPGVGWVRCKTHLEELRDPDVADDETAERSLAEAREALRDEHVVISLAEAREALRNREEP